MKELGVFRLVRLWVRFGGDVAHDLARLVVDDSVEAGRAYAVVRFTSSFAFANVCYLHDSFRSSEYRSIAPFHCVDWWRIPRHMRRRIARDAISMARNGRIIDERQEEAL